MNTFLEAAINGWWQGIVLTLMVWLVLRDLPRVSAATRVAIWQVTLGVVLLLPLLQRIPVPRWPESSVVEKTSAKPFEAPLPRLSQAPVSFDAGKVSACLTWRTSKPTRITSWCVPLIWWGLWM